MADGDTRHPAFAALALALAAAAALLAPAGGGPALAAPDAKSLFRAQIERHRAGDEEVEWRMTIADGAGEEKSRTAVVMARTGPGGESKSLVRFTAPPNVRGTGLLTWADGRGAIDQWLFLPAIRRSLRVAAERRKLSLADTDLSVEDFRPPSLERDRFESLAPEPLDGAPCQRVKVSPPAGDAPAEAGWRVFWIRDAIAFTVGIDVHGPGGELLKTVRALDLVKVGETAWRPDRVVVRRLPGGSTTTLAAVRRRVGEALPDRIFTVRELEEGFR